MSPPNSAVEIQKVVRRFGDVVALNGVDLSIREGEFFSLLGPSGCGKTTLLRLIAGLDVADSGTIRIGGADATHLPAHQRPVNTVFQSYALFPHMTVSENVAFGLRMKHLPAARIEERVKAMLDLVEIASLGQRKPAELSGGQKQRVALARAIINEPRVLLLDEPMAALDLKLRKQLQVELRRLQRRLGMTFVYVTHDQEEALLLSDRLAVMNAGRIEQLGDAATVYERPRTRFVSTFLGDCTLIDAVLVKSIEGGMRVSTSIGELTVASAAPSLSRFTLAIRPEKVRLLARTASVAENVITARVESNVYAGSATHYELRAGEQRLTMELLNSEADSSGLDIGQAATVSLPAEALVVLEDTP